jgi:molybdenum cofactor cytidylyltransferase
MVTAIVLAAGLSTRMGKQNKLLLSFGKKTVIETVSQNLIAAGLPEIIVVTGHEADTVKEKLAHLSVNVIYNAAYEEGMTTSIQAGVSVAKGDGYMICLSDMPLIKAEEYALIKEAFERQNTVNERGICIPRFANEKGNPVVFSAYYKQAILDHKDMEGCRQIIQENKENITWVDIGSKSVLKDMDTFVSYQEIHKQREE